MEPVSHLVKISIPNYLAGLPIPDSIGGWFRLGIRDWIALVPPTAILAGLGYMSYKAFCPLARGPVCKSCFQPCGRVNLTIKKDVNKVVDSVDIEDITDKAAFCRCWRSQNWPYCDGSHGRHNEEVNDNVGPLVITKKN
ncbi:CDGSH iron-sulfur domain-containing protein 2 homolog [Anthophora retusa]